MNQEKTTYTLITGASLGIGKSLAYECAKKGMNLILVALPGNELTALAESIRTKYHVNALPYPVDLTADNAPIEIFDWCMANGYRVNVLINNAGIGTGGSFEDIDIGFYLKMLKLNNQALVGLTYYFIPELKKHSQSYILNTSSMEGIIPLPYKSVYTASKNFIYTFSLALREELKPYKISVSVLCPGPVITNKGGLSRLRAQGVKGRILAMMPSQVAKKALKSLLKGKAIIVPGYLNLLLTRVAKLVPIVPRMKILEHLFRVYKTMPH